MNTHAAAPTTHLKEGGLHTAMSLGASGQLEVVRITKPLPAQGGELVFAVAPARDGSKARTPGCSVRNSSRQKRAHGTPPRGNGVFQSARFYKRVLLQIALHLLMCRSRKTISP